MVRRGPDATNRVTGERGFEYVHNLLSMTGAGLTLQPFVSADGKRVALFNGEIYNFKVRARARGRAHSALAASFRFNL